jgi:hypothetical protein
MTAGIYKITERKTGRCYIGQSKHIEKRWEQHHTRFSQELFDYEVLRVVHIKEFMNTFEKFYIKKFDSHVNGFNCTVGGTGVKSIYQSEETKRKISATTKGRPQPLRYPPHIEEWFVCV